MAMARTNLTRLPEQIKKDIDDYTKIYYPEFVSLVFLDRATDAIRIHCYSPGVRYSFNDIELLSSFEFESGNGPKLTGERIRAVLDKMYGQKTLMMDTTEYEEILSAQEIMNDLRHQEVSPQTLDAGESGVPGRVSACDLAGG